MNLEKLNFILKLKLKNIMRIPYNKTITFKIIAKTEVWI